MSNDAAYEIQTVDRLIATINQGEDGQDVTQDYRKALETIDRYVDQYGGKHKATINIKISLEADPKGVDVKVECKVTPPARPTNKERFFISERGTLTLKDPGRDTMFPGTDLGRKTRRETE